MPEKRNEVKSVSKAMRVIKALIELKVASPKQLSEMLKVPRPTIYRILWAMESEGAVSLIDGKCVLGPMLYDVAVTRSWEAALVELCKPHLWSLRERTQATVALYLANNLELVCFEVFPSPYEVPATPRVGERLPLTRGASGKCFLAWHCTEAANTRDVLRSLGVPEEEIEGWCDRLSAIRRSRTLVTRSERVPGGVAIASPILTSEQKILGVASVSGPIGRISDDQAMEIAARLEECIEKIEGEIQKASSFSSEVKGGV